MANRADPWEEIVVNARKWSVLVLGVWLGMSQWSHGQEPGPLARIPAGDANRLPPPPSLLPPLPLAQAIARALQESGKLSRYRVQVIAKEGIVDLVGDVADEKQREIVINIARSAPGVVMVRDWMQVRPDPNVITAQAPLLPAPQLLAQPQQFDGPRMPERIDGQFQDPTPIFQAPPGPNPTMQPPPLPPYAWPTTAPYNNYSRVAYPLAYPHEQWPFIGPMYPFPRVPLGWRSVSLTWEDGHWWYHRNPTGHDWWRVRYH